MNWSAPASAFLAAAAGALAFGPWGLAFAVVGAAALLPMVWRPFAYLPLAALPTDLDPAGLLTLGLLAAAIVVALPWTRETLVAAPVLLVLVPAALWAVPRLATFFEGDAGLAAFFVGGAAVASLGAALAMLPGGRALEE